MTRTYSVPVRQKSDRNCLNNWLRMLTLRFSEIMKCLSNLVTERVSMGQQFLLTENINIQLLQTNS